VVELANPGTDYLNGFADASTVELADLESHYFWDEEAREAAAASSSIRSILYVNTRRNSAWDQKMPSGSRSPAPRSLSSSLYIQSLAYRPCGWFHRTRARFAISAPVPEC
jgi:hypothetical protein